MGDGASVMGTSLNIHWTDKLEDYFVRVGEKAQCLGWLHKQAEAMFSRRKTFIDLPVIIGSSTIAFLSAGSATISVDTAYKDIYLGVGSLLVGVLNTLGTYFGWAKRSEGHRISAIHYSKLYRFIALELALPRNERSISRDFLKYVRDQYDRLSEVSPLIPHSIIREFKQKFRKYTTISKPEEANGLEKIRVYNRDDDTVSVYVPEPSTRPPRRRSSDSTFTTQNPFRSSLPDPQSPPNRSTPIRESFVPSEKMIEEVSQSVTIPDIPADVIDEYRRESSSS